MLPFEQRPSSLLGEVFPVVSGPQYLGQHVLVGFPVPFVETAILELSARHDWLSPFFGGSAQG